MTYPTAADLRQAANEAILKRCDDPLLSKIMEAAASAAAQGETSCRVEFPDPIDQPRADRICDATAALGLATAWMPPREYAAGAILLSW